MSNTAHKLTLTLLGSAALWGCVAEAPRVLNADIGTPAGVEPPVWPARPAVPRYAYVGELTGEGNFQSVDGGPRLRASAVFAFLVGLGLDEERPTVLQRPQGGAADAAGRVLVTDISHQAVFVFNPGRESLEVWRFAEDGVRFRAPIGVALGAAGQVLVTDAELGAVFSLDAAGKPRARFGEAVLQRPTGIVRDPRRGLIYVADTRANDVKVFDDAGVFVDYLGRGGDGVGELNAPTYLALGPDRLYVTDTLNARIQVYGLDGGALRSIGERGLYVGNLARPKGVTADRQGNVYVVEGFYDHLLIYDEQGRFLLPIGGTGKAPGQFYLPAGVWTDGGNRIFVADMFNGRVSIFQFLGGR